MKALLPITLFILCLVVVQPATAQQGHGHTTASAKSLSESEKISQLIEVVRQMKGATFIRNGTAHTCQEAAEHLEAKWRKHNSKIKSAEDFITYLATKSSTSGEPYMIRFEDGSETPTAEVLREALGQLK